MRKQLTKIRAEINELENRSAVELINRTRRWFFERIHKIDRPLARLVQKQRERTEIIKIMTEKGEVMTNSIEIGTQSQEKIWKKLKHLETKNHPAQE